MKTKMALIHEWEKNDKEIFNKIDQLEDENPK